MTPETLVIDRRFRGVGRIRRASGTTDPKLRRNYSRMLDAFKDQGRVDLLKAIQDGSLTFAECYVAHRRHALNELIVGETAKPLAPAWDAWLESHRKDYSAKHAVSLGQSLKYLTRAKAARIADLPRALRELRGSLGSEHARSYNVTRAAVLAFLRSTLTKAHPLWLQCSAVEVRKVTPKRKGVHLTPEHARNFFPAPESDPVDAIAWGMLSTGMHEQEYFEDGFHVRAGCVRIEGRKRGGRDRDVPLVVVPPAPSMHRRTFTDKLRERTVRKLQPYDLRRTYAHWLEQAQIPRTRRKLYMGHGATDVTDLYERHEVDAFLERDGDRIRAFLGLSHTIPHMVRLSGTGGKNA